MCFFVLSCRLDTDIIVPRTGKANKKAAKKLKEAMKMMGAMMNAGSAVANNCTSA